MPAQLHVLPDLLEKACSKCQQIKPLSQFSKDSGYQSGVRAWCKTCCAQYGKQWRASNPQYLEKRKAHYLTNIKEERKKDRIHYHSHKEQHKNSRLRSEFGITLKDYEAMLAVQKNKCAICGDEPQTGPLAVDHCHTSGRVRGLLCGQCNLALGGFKDNTRLLQAAITYLELRG